MHRDDDAEIIAAARVGFLDEAADMLQQFEQALLVMETDPADAENLNAAFRAAHTIKGTALAALRSRDRQRQRKHLRRVVAATRCVR
jgi:chemotaxis protein histidine kinase CheA